MTKLLMLTFAVALIGVAADAKPNCKKGVPCGNTCIQAGMTCHMTTPTPAPTPSSTPPKCVTGKLCGNTCIKATETCHKP
jgi:hypothetical protein